MAEIKLYIGDDYLDLTDSKSIPLNIQSQTIFKPAEVKGNFSRSFDVPRTDRNCQILQMSFDYSVDSDFPYQKIDALLVVDGIEFSKGFVVVENNGLSEEAIKLTFYNGNSYFFNIINNLKLRDCKGFGLASHLWNDEYIEKSKTNPHYIYALVDYTGESHYFSDTDVESVYASRLLPCVYANLYRYAIEKETGYKLKGELFQSDAFTKLLFPFSKSKFERRIEDTESRINCDLEYWIQKQYPSGNYNNVNKVELLEVDNIYHLPTGAGITKYGNDNFVGYVGLDGGGATYRDTQSHLFFPDYTISTMELEMKFTTGAVGQFTFSIGDETIPNGERFLDVALPNTMQFTLYNSVTGIAVTPAPLNYTSRFHFPSLPQSYNANPNLNYDWILKIKFDFITGLKKSIGFRFQNSASLYVYYNKTKVRFKQHIAKEDIKTYYHSGALGYLNYVVYGGKNIKVVSGGNVYEYIAGNVPALNIPTSNASYWNLIGADTPTNRLIPILPEEKESEYYEVKYGGLTDEVTQLNNIWRANYSWITGGDLVPEQNVSWWIKGIANYFGCYIKVDDDNKEVTFKSWKEIYDDIPSAKDLTKKVVNHKSSFWTSRNEGVGQTSYLKFTNSDFVSKEFGNASITIADNSIPLEATIIQLPFSASETISKFNGRIDVPLIKKFNGGTDYAGVVSISSQQHMLLLNQYNWNDGNILLIQRERLDYDISPLGNAHYVGAMIGYNDNCPFAYFNDNQQSIQLGFDAYALYNYHRWLNYIFDNFKVLTCQMKLDATDINTIDTLMPIYLEYYNSYFLLNRIYDWVNGEISKVELLKLN